MTCSRKSRSVRRVFLAAAAGSAFVVCLAAAPLVAVQQVAPVATRAAARQTPVTRGSQGTNDPGLTERIQRLEQGAEVTAVRIDERLKSLNDRYESMYRLFQVVSVIAGVALAILTINDIRQRRREGKRQRGLDEIGKDMMNLQKAAAEQQLNFGRLQLDHTNESLEHQVQSVKSVNEVIGVVRQTLDFRLEQERKVAQALHDIEEIRDQRKRDRELKLKQAKSILEPFLRMSRMEFAVLTEEQYKRGVRLRSLVEDLTFAPEDFELSGNLFYTCGVLAYYDNDIIDAKDFLERAVEVRAADHEGALNTDQKYRKRFAFAHYFRALIQKNWGDLSEALHEIEQSDRLIGNQSDEFLTPVTKAEIYSVMEPIDGRCRPALDGLLNRMDSLEQALRNDGNKTLNANQVRLRNRMLLLYGNTYFVEKNYVDALSKYTAAIQHNQRDYYALASAGQCAALTNNSVVTAHDFFEGAVRAVERSGDITRKRERITRAVLAVTTALAAQGVHDESRWDEYARHARELLSGDLAVDGLLPKFFSPSKKHLVSAEELLSELTLLEAVGV
jgi:tetratricopeptide (TPR) repeat protein